MSKVINLLLVEDDQLDAMDIKRSLNKLNILYKLVWVKNGEEALLVLENRCDEAVNFFPDIILLDINMPRMNGFELLQQIRNQPEWKEVKCFMITTSDESVDKVKAQQFKVSGYIIKPLKLNSPTSIDAFNLMIDLLNLKNEA
jgi:CheY-like chemotaxis protein